VSRLLLPLRFFAVSTLLFLLWANLLREPYLRVLARSLQILAGLAGRWIMVLEVRDGVISFASEGIGFSDPFGWTASNQVAFAALLLCTPDLALRRRLRLLALGTLALFGTHLAGLACDLFQAGGTSAAARSFFEALRALLVGFGAFFAPVFFWLVAVRDRLPLPGRASKSLMDTTPSP
jgi:hypothetical protein